MIKLLGNFLSWLWLGIRSSLEAVKLKLKTIRVAPTKPFIFLLIFIGFLIFLKYAFAITEQEKKILEEELRKLEKQIVETEGLIGEVRQEKKTLSNEISRFNKEITKKNLQIKAINLSINKLEGEIEENGGEVDLTENKLSRNKRALRNALQGIYEQETETLVEILLKSPSISQFFSGVNDLLAVQDSLRSSLEEAVILRNQLLDEREKLALSKADKESLKLYQDQEKRNLQSKQEEKKELLAVTAGKESKYQELLEISKQTAAQIRNRIFEFLGGGQLTFEQAYQLAKSAGDLIGVRPAMILAVLDRESALGANVGRCNYQTAMHPSRDIPIFLEITKSLGIDPNSVNVSCPISGDGAYGGAMGPSQFIPSTWNIYQNDVARLTGSNPPSPWRNFDAVVGTALYLKDARNSSACLGYSKEIPAQEQILLDRCAAARYYAGSRWYRYRWTYGERVLEKARKFDEDIAQII